MKNSVLIIVLLFLSGSPGVLLGGEGMRSTKVGDFRIQYERGISLHNAKLFGETLGAAVTEMKKMLEVTITGKVDVLMYTSVNRFKRESQTRIFDDGDWNGGKIYYVLASGRVQEEKMQAVARRLAARLVLSHTPGCPPWFAEAYSLSVGGDLERFGKPARSMTSSFSDLGEDYVSAERPKDALELYAKLASTIEFFDIHFGKSRVEDALKGFKTSENIHDVFQSAFQEKFEEIEKDWVKALRSEARQ